MLVNNIKINADDFGLKQSVNKAVIEAFDKEYINSTTLMANMPAFDDAIYLIHEHDLISKTGVHLVLTEGTPLTDKIKSVDFLFNGKVKLKDHLLKSYFSLNKIQEELIFNEFCTQIKRIQLKGINITHIDTHHHVHEFYCILKIIMKVKKLYNIPFIRILNNTEDSTRAYKQYYRWLINTYIKINKANFSDIFGNQTDLLLRFKKKPIFNDKEKIEIMVHPDYDNEGKLIDKVGKETFHLDIFQLINDF